MSTTTLAEVQHQFKDVIGDNDKLYEECLNLCRIYNLDAEGLYYKYEATNFTSTPGGRRDSELSRYTFTMDTLAALTQAISRERGQQQKAKKANRNNMLAANINKRNMPAHFNRNLQRASGGLSAVKSEPNEVKMEDGTVAGPSKVVFSCPSIDASLNSTRPSRYMRAKTKDRATALDQRLLVFANLIRAHYKVDIGDPTLMNEEEIVAVGRITHDEDSADSNKLNESMLTLEPPHVYANSRPTIPLRFEPNVRIRGAPEGAPFVGLFPGAVVALKGKNGSKDWFSVSEILTLPPASASSKMPAGNSFSMAVASGPFTPDADLDYKPFKQWLQSIKPANPSVLLLQGPFIDTANSRIKVGAVDHSPVEMFQKYVGDPLRAYLDSAPGTIALLVPSVRDVISPHAVVPQTQLPSYLTRADSRIKLLPNPARFSINGVAFATTTVDVVYHLKTQEVKVKGVVVEPSKTSPDDADPMGSICRHLLHQRTFYPLHPVPADVSREVNLDMTRSKDGTLHLTQDPEGRDTPDIPPDVLILPSRFKQFSKVVHTTAAINPSFLAKGSYALLKIDPKGTVGTSDRVAVELIKLDI